MMPENPPAFPLHPDALSSHRSGMTMRDWFAGQALTGILASANTDAVYLLALKHGPKGAFELADAMLAERERGAS